MAEIASFTIKARRNGYAYGWNRVFYYQGTNARRNGHAYMAEIAYFTIIIIIIIILKYLYTVAFHLCDFQRAVCFKKNYNI